MGVLLENRLLGGGFFLLSVQEPNAARMGQFYMVRAWGHYPVLSRPISVYNRDSETVQLLCKEIGEGTALLSKLRPGDDIRLDGPYGNGFPAVMGKTALVGGGVGIAPLYLAAKCLKEHDPNGRIDIYLGFSDEALLESEYRAVCDALTVDVGGFVTDRIDAAGYDQVLCCGPDIMMRVLHKRCEAAKTPLYISMENRMACGLGACLVCSCKTPGGNRKVCKDGPVFPSTEVYFDA